jgi:hypothetical protein
VADIGSRDRASKVSGRITLRPAGGNGIHEDLAGIGLCPMGIFQVPPSLNAT